MLKFQELLNFTIIKQHINLQINIILNAKLIRIQKSSLPIYFSPFYYDLCSWGFLHLSYQHGGSTM